MKLPLRIDADAAGNPVLIGGSYALLDKDGKRIALFDLDYDGGCLGTVRALRRIVRLVNAETGIRNALSGLVELGTGLLNDMGGCDHAVGICQCADKALVDQGKEVLFRLEAPAWPGEQRHADLFEDIKDVLQDLIGHTDNTGDPVVQPDVDNAKRLLAELNRVQL